MQAEFPHYSDKLVALARAYDRAALACLAAGWHLSDLMENNPVEYGSADDLAAYTEKRIDLLRESLSGIRDVLNALIQQESAPHFEVAIDGYGELTMPDVVANALSPYMNEVRMIAHFDGREEAMREVINLACQDRQVIVFDDDIYTLPKSYPASFIEVWWRRWFYSLLTSPGKLYELCLEPNPEYGWDCYGHER